MKKIVLLSGLFLLLSLASFAQLGAIKGFVYDKANGESMSFATIQLVGTTLGTQSDGNGYFIIPKLKEGKYAIEISVMGYESQEVNFELTAGQVVSKKVFLVKKITKNVKGAVISAKKQEKILETKVGVTKITSKEIKALPSVGGEPDIAQYLQVLPGVTFTGDQGGQLYIRGGSPVQNKILLDGMTIYNPFHSIGLFSVFETEGIKNAEVMSGGFGAEYGDRTSAIVNVTTKDGNKNKMSGKIGVSPIMAKIFLEGPLLKPKTQDGLGISYVLSYKNSYLDKTSMNMYGGFGEPFKVMNNTAGSADSGKYVSGLPFSFNDFYGKININGGNGSKFNFFGFSFNDKVNYPTSLFNWKNSGIGSNFVISTPSSSSLITGGFYYSNYNIGLTEADNKPRSSSINGFEGNLAITSYLKNNSEMKYGFEVAGFTTNYQFYNYLGYSSDQNDNTTQLGAFFKYKANFNNKFIFEPSMRMQYYASLSVISPEPRVSMKYNFNKNFRIKAAVGRYSQNLISSKSDKDIVNLFTGFLSGPDGDLTKPNGQTAKNNVQYANHYIGGIEYDYNNFEFTVEPWFKDFRQLITFNRYKQTADDPDFLIETGTAKGIDFTAKYNKGRTYLWAVYSYGNITRFDGVQNYPPPFDRRHNLNLLGTYTAGKKWDWEFSARFNYGSAFPFTLTQSLYQNVDFSQNGLNTNYLTQNGTMNILYDKNINNGRLSDYARLDLSAKKKFFITTTSTIDVTAGLTNSLNRNNIFYINRLTNAKQYQLPLFPTLAVSWGF